MKKRKEAREEVAASHRLIKEEIHKLEANQLKLRRLHCKVYHVNRLKNGNIIFYNANSHWR